MSQIVADSLLLLVTVIWGTTFVVVKEAISAIKPFTFIAVRFLLAAFFCWLLCFCEHTPPGRTLGIPKARLLETPRTAMRFLKPDSPASAS